MDAPRLPERYRLVTFESLDSTNSEIRRRAEEKAPDGTLVWAMEQLQGRGRHGRTWRSPPGNLYCSLLLRPRCPPSRATQISFIGALAVLETACELLPQRSVTCKWPNDVLVEGRKLAGILLESMASSCETLEWLTLGVGVNIMSHPAASEVRYPATSLAAEGAKTLDPASVLETYCVKLDRWLAIWEKHGFGPVRDAWLARAEGRYRTIVVHLEPETISGTFEDLDENGALVLRRDGIRQLVLTGDVVSAWPGGS